MRSTSKISLAIATIGVAALALVGCASADAAGAPAGDTSTKTETEQTQEVEEAPEPVSLEGEWKQTNSDDPERWQMATVTGTTIEVYWIADAGDTKALYWAGTVEVPAEGEMFSFESANDTAKTDASMLASSDATKKFTYDKGELSYDVTVQGITKTVRLGRE